MIFNENIIFCKISQYMISPKNMSLADVFKAYTTDNSGLDEITKLNMLKIKIDFLPII